MKRLAIFCDGTWSDLGLAQRTNVARLAKCVSDVDAKGVQQVVWYDTGVGTSQGVSKLVDWLTGLEGGAFGQGLDGKVEEAYRFLALNHEAGDEVYVFGFSRGAYTARSLCGLIRKCGIVRRECLDMVPAAMKLYRNKAHPADVSGFRDQYGQRTADGRPLATGWEDLPDVDERQARWDARHGPSSTRSTRGGDIYKLMYLGVWDTVGALGIPGRFPLAAWVNRRYRFHDTDASSLITHLRHAVAVDEDRASFEVTPVSNIEALNRDWGRATGKAVDDPAAKGFVAYPERPYQQRWFPGDHGAVGGGNPEPGLSSGALLWIAEGAQLAGLELRRVGGNELYEAAKLYTPLADWRVGKDGRKRSKWAFDMIGLAAGYRDRLGPLAEEELHEGTVRRLEARPEWRPAPLERFTGKLQAVPRYRVLARALGPLLWLGAWAAAMAAAFLLMLALAGLWYELQGVVPWARAMAGG
jgi:uncharacterized protein (DUF2235 family)